MARRAGATLTALALWAGTALSQAQLTIDVGTLSLQGGIEAMGSSTPATLDIRVYNPGAALAIGGLDFAIEIAADGPRIQSVDLLSGTIFQFNHMGPIPSSSNTDHRQFYTMTKDFFMSAPQLPTGYSKVGTITLSAAGVAPGDYTLKLDNTYFGNTVYNSPTGSPYGLSISSGILSVSAVPEPRHYAMVAGCGLLVLAFARRSVRTGSAPPA